MLFVKALGLQYTVCHTRAWASRDLLTPDNIARQWQLPSTSHPVLQTDGIMKTLPQRPGSVGHGIHREHQRPSWDWGVTHRQPVCTMGSRSKNCGLQTAGILQTIVLIANNMTADLRHGNIAKYAVTLHMAAFIWVQGLQAQPPDKTTSCDGVQPDVHRIFLWSVMYWVLMTRVLVQCSTGYYVTNTNMYARIWQ